MKNNQIGPAKIHSLSQNSKPTGPVVALPHKTGHNMDIKRSPSITHFARKIIAPISRPAVVATVPKKQMDIVSVASKKSTIKPEVVVNPPVIKPTKILKEEAIADATKKMPAIQTQEKAKLHNHHKIISIFSASVVILIVLAFLLYINVPAISVNIAGSQANVQASYPEYVPSGYSPSIPVAYKNGQIIINFHANTGNNHFSIKEANSSWDSSAVKDMVNKTTNGQFLTITESGLTIYTYDNNAIWVNGGILYTISGNTLFSNDQIRRMAISL
jgi:hypothetical protein